MRSDYCERRKIWIVVAVVFCLVSNDIENVAEEATIVLIERRAGLEKIDRGEAETDGDLIDPSPSY